MSTRIGDRVTVWLGTENGRDIFADGVVEDRWDGTYGVVLDSTDGSIWRTTPSRIYPLGSVS